MEGLLEILVPLVRLLSSSVLVVLFFMFVVRPLFNYFIVNSEIEHHKKLIEEFDVPSAASSVINSTPDAMDEDLTQPKDEGIDALNRMAASNSDKAVDLVKQWVNSDSKR